MIIRMTISCNLFPKRTSIPALASEVLGMSLSLDWSPGSPVKRSIPHTYTSLALDTWRTSSGRACHLCANHEFQVQTSGEPRERGLHGWRSYDSSADNSEQI